MKKLLAIITTLAVIFTLALPMQAFAANMDQSLENAIKIAKTKFEIPADYKFTSSISSEGAKKVFYLNWNGTDTVNPKSINITIDDSGMIMSYYSYSPEDYILKKKLPAMSRLDAKARADEIIKMIDPKLPSHIQYQENTQANLMDSSYYLNYYRVENGIPFYNDRVSVNINRDTGKLLNYNRNWSNVASFPAAVNNKVLAQAQDFYKMNLGLKLIYKYTNDNDTIKVFPVYTPVYDNNNFAVNAFTGDRVQTGYNYYGPYFSGTVAYDMKRSAKNESAAITLNPDEQKAVEDAAKLKTMEEAEKIARAAEFLGLTDEYKLTNYNLNQNYPDRSQYVWNLNFNKEDKENPNLSHYVSAGINANTGEIVNFYRSVPIQQDAKGKYDMAASKAGAEEFLKKYYPDYFKQVKYNESGNSGIVYPAVEMPQNYNFNYERIVNGITFPDNGMYVNYDAVNGLVTNFNLNWLKADFPSVDNAIKIGTAYTKLFSDIGLGLEYKFKIQLPAADAKIIVPPVPAVSEVELVYALKQGPPLFLDAFTGNVVDYSGAPWKEVKPLTYTDIKGNYAEKLINVLADNGVYLDGTEFKPDANITQKDFLTLISKTLSYYGPVITLKSTANDIDQLYTYLIREGVVKEGEKKPDASVTNEEAVKFIIRAMKLDKAADLKGIYICSFKDKSKIDPALTGYVALAAGFKIAAGKNGYFSPKSNLTRAGAAVMIYNYLQVG